MEKTEPAFVPEWLKSSGGLSTSSSLHLDNQGVKKSERYKSSDSDLGRPSVSDRTTSSYFCRASISNGSASSRSYSSFNRNNCHDRDLDKDIYEFRNKEKSDNRRRDYSDPLGNILPSRFEKDGLRRSHSSISEKRGESWPRKSASDFSIANKSGHNNGSISSVKTSFERDFPSLGADEKQTDTDIGRVPSPGLSSAIQSLPIGSSAVIGGDGWTSALTEVPVIVGSNGNGTSLAQPVPNFILCNYRHDRWSQHGRDFGSRSTSNSDCSTGSHDSFLAQSLVLGPDGHEPKKKLKNIVMQATREQRFERVTKNLKVARVFTTLVEEMKAIGIVSADDSQCTDVMVPMAHRDRSPLLLFMGHGMGAVKSTILKDLLKEPFLGRSINKCCCDRGRCIQRI